MGVWPFFARRAGEDRTFRRQCLAVGRVSVRKTVYSASATADNAAFAAEGVLQLKYQVTGQLALKIGYEALWLDGIALAPGQIKETVTASTPTTASEHMLGVNSGSNVLFQGVTAGLEYSF